MPEDCSMQHRLAGGKINIGEVTHCITSASDMLQNNKYKRKACLLAISIQ